MDITATLVTPEGAQVGSWPCGGFGAVVIDDSSRRTMSLTVMMMTMTLIHCLFAIVSEIMTMIIRIRLNVVIVMMVMMMVTMLMIMIMLMLLMRIMTLAMVLILTIEGGGIQTQCYILGCLSLLIVRHLRNPAQERNASGN